MSEVGAKSCIFREECEKKEPERLCDEENLRVLYVAGTRAKECLIIADSTKPGNNAWSDLSCDIHDIDANNDDTPEYQKMIEMGEKYSSNDSGEKEHLVDINEKISQYNHLKEEKDKIIKELESVAKITIKPSEQEKHISTDTVDSNYMRGNMYGTMMHKFFELAVKEVWKGILKHKSGVIQLDQIEISDEDIKAMIRKSVAAGLESESLTSGQCKRLKIKDNIEQILSKTLIEQEEILTKHLFKEFEKIGNALINDKEFWNDLVEAEAIYPEMPFEFKAEKDNVKDDIKKYQQGQDIYVRGTMDLVLELKDRFIIWDYKSNVITPSEDVDAFTQRLYREYEPQLRIYKEALKNIIANDETKCNKPIETKLYHRFRNED